MSTIYNEEYLADQMQQFRELQVKYQELEQKYQELTEEYQTLQNRYSLLNEEYETYKNARSKAGRRPNDEKWTARYKAFAKMKEEGCKREYIQEKLNMSRATYFRYNKIYSGEAPEEFVSPVEKMIKGKALAKSLDQIICAEDPTTVRISSRPLIEIDSVEETVPEKKEPVENTAAVEPTKQEVSHSGLVLDPDTGEYVTPEGLRRRKKLAEIRARRAAEEALKQAQKEADPQL